MNKHFLRYIEMFVFLLIVIIFCYFRLKPILLESVGYTYDQGRDFLKAAEIVVYKNPTFIGPTTGIMGIYHGAWWYYLLAIGFFLFNGNPIGFYYFNFIIQSVVFILFYFFSKKYFDFVTSLILSLLIASGSYFIFSTIFIANNVMAMATFPLLLMGSYLLFQEKANVNFFGKKYTLPVFFLTGLLLGLVAEFEFAFGLLLTPLFILLVLLFVFFKKINISLQKNIFFLFGLCIPFSLRLLFEIKNNFPQSKTLISFIIHPNYFTPKPYPDIVRDRMELFTGYFNGMFLSDPAKFLTTLFILFFLFVFIIRKKLTTTFIFTLLLGLGLFIVATLYKDTFWKYYYDGIQYLFLIIIGYLISSSVPKWQRQLNYLRSFLLGILLLLTFQNIYNDTQAQYIYDGIKVQKDIVSYIQGNEPEDKYCVKIYTPPVIPYTYDYLFFYNNYLHKKSIPEKDWQHNKCWIIIEYDEYKERKEKWIQDNIPAEATKISTKRVKDVDVELWQYIREN